MAKQFIISAMEEVFGEYILNMSKENMKIAVLKGQVKLENVQLDGDLLGSHVLGAFGLEGFGILSCHAESLLVHIPWKNLEKEPTRFEVRGVHLLCVPLIASTAGKVYGNTRGENCNLRTKAKRLLLARFERNFWNGQIPNEGPPMKRVVRAAREVEREMKKSEVNLDELLKTMGNDDSEQPSSQGTADNFPDLPRDWKVKLREKILRNLEATLSSVHVRCEASAGSLSAEDELNESTDFANRSAEKRPFAFGFTLDTLVVRTANEKWKIGRHDTRNPVDGSAMSSDQGHLGPNEYLVKNNKIGYFHNLSMYWDDEPPILLSQTDVFSHNSKRYSVDKLQLRVAWAMNALFNSQEPGNAVREKFAAGLVESTSPIPHQYIVEKFYAEIRSRSSDRTKPGPISCSADVLPFHLEFNLRPHQFRQYLELKHAVQTQQRLDTMYRQRPNQPPAENPLAWWKYAIACVIARPHSRPWDDVKRIGKYRRTYVDLVVKKNLKRDSSKGLYHGGLSQKESDTLLEIEDFLPNEVLQALHLAALRRAYNQSQSGSRSSSRVNTSDDRSMPGRQQRLSSRFRILPRSGGSRSRVSSRQYSRVRDDFEGSAGDASVDSDHITASDNEVPQQLTLVEAMDLRLGKKTWFINWKIHDAFVMIKLLTKGGSHHSHLSSRLNGTVRSFGKGKRDFFIDTKQLEVYNGNRRILYPPLQSTNYGEAPMDDESFTDDSIASHSVRWSGLGTSEAGPDLETPGDYLDLPPDSVVCRVVAGRTFHMRKFSISAHPITCVWKSSFFDGLASFLPSNSSIGQENVRALRNAATPLARKARLAMLSPGTTAFFFNIQSPKVWVPISTETGNAVVYMESGGLLGSSFKTDEIGPKWNISFNAIQVDFVRHKSSSNDHWVLEAQSRGLVNDSITVVKPFDVDVSSFPGVHSSDGIIAASSSDEIRSLRFIISPLYVNLVDAEVLARAFGKVYARNIHNMRSRKFTADSFNDSMGTISSNKTLNHDMTEIHFLFQLEEARFSLEGHSKMSSLIADDRSSFSVDSANEGKSDPNTRTYHVALREISLMAMKGGTSSNVSFIIQDLDIVRQMNNDRNFLSTPLQDRDPIYRILERSQTIYPTTTVAHPILKLAFSRNFVKHLDEVSIDIASIIVRITPLTLKDSAKAFKRLAEIVQLVTQEMERKVHEEGRKARKKEVGGNLLVAGLSESRSQMGRPDSPVLSETLTDLSLREPNEITLQDSSIVFRVSLNDCTMLAGKPAQGTNGSKKKSNHAVVQVLTDCLILFQSVENYDGTGSRTLHVSLNNFSSIVNNTFDRVPPVIASPMIGPTGAELRIVFTTQQMESIVSQDISFDLETIKACLTPNDLVVIMNVGRSMLERLVAFGDETFSIDPSKSSRERPKLSLLQVLGFRRKGSGIATNIKVDMQEISFILLRAYKSKFGAPEFLKFCAKGLGGRFDGCISALMGDFRVNLSIGYFKPNLQEWEDVLEPMLLGFSANQLPDEFVLKVVGKQVLNLNFTGQLLRDLLEMKSEFSRDRVAGLDSGGLTLNQSALSTVGLRRATEARSIMIKNDSGIDLHVHPDSTPFDANTGFLRTNDSVTLHADLENADISDMTFVVRCAESSKSFIGDREEVYDLPLCSKQDRPRLCLLKARNQPLSDQSNLSRDSFGDDFTNTLVRYYGAEPVVEFYMQNQRLKSNRNDESSLRRGEDLLSGIFWSADDTFGGVSTLNSNQISEDSTGVSGLARGNWSKPYLNNDIPEFTDMTLYQTLNPERVLLPDNNWVWVSDWTVDLQGKLGETTDADGWEYAEDFDSFSRERRCYRKGDTCRRRRWVRTRMMKPPRLDDPFRLLRFVWDTKIDAEGNYSISIRSTLRVKNTTSISLAIFLSSPTWEADHLAGRALPSECLDVPVTISSAVFMRVAKVPGTEPPTLENSICSDPILILPSSEVGSNMLRASMDLRDVSGTKFHYLIEIRNDKGLVEITIHPILRVVNLLPCQLECSLGEMFRPGEKRTKDYRPCLGSKTRAAVNIETMKISSGTERSNNVINPCNRPLISLRVPGYTWSPWHRIINRGSSLVSTFRPSEAEKETFVAHDSDPDFPHELKTVIRLQRVDSGDQLTVLMGVTSGHCPTVTVFAQYWILDQSGFGCRFSETAGDFLGIRPDEFSSRRSYITPEEEQDSVLKEERKLPGHQWSIGMNGMSLYFSRKKKIVVSIQTGAGTKRSGRRKICDISSKWAGPFDVSNVIPKTVFSIDEMNGHRCFELAISVKLCHGLFSRSKMIILMPRYQIVNQLHRELLVAQEGCTDTPSRLPAQSSSPFHWTNGDLPPKLRLGVKTISPQQSDGDYTWTNGKLRVDRVGLSSIRLPTSTGVFETTPLVIQAEVRLASKEQACAAVVVLWVSNDRSNPLYVLRNCTPYSILCYQPLRTDHEDTAHKHDLLDIFCRNENDSIELKCGGDLPSSLLTFLDDSSSSEFVWVLKKGTSMCFGFDDPEKAHALEWTCVADSNNGVDQILSKAILEIDTIGSSSILSLPDGKQVRCQIIAEYSTKTIEFSELNTSSPGLPTRPFFQLGTTASKSFMEEEELAVSFQLHLAGMKVSVIDNTRKDVHGREILLVDLGNFQFSFNQTMDGYHEFEFRLLTLQIDNHIRGSTHPILLFCPRIQQDEPFLHISAVRLLQRPRDTHIFRYIAIRILEVEIFLDRRTSEKIAAFIEPIILSVNDEHRPSELPEWANILTDEMSPACSAPHSQRNPSVLKSAARTSNTGRIYIEQLHLHPVRIGLTFTQEWMENDSSPDSILLFQFIRGMGSISNAPLMFTSFMVGHVFESPQALSRVIASHYSSQLTKQIFGILGSLAILGAPADFISNVGTGLVDFFYEPINGAVHGPRQFVQGLEAGTQSLARGVLVGVVRGAANVTETLNSNLAGLTADDNFVEERNAYRRMLADAMSRGDKERSLRDSLALAGSSFVRGIRSGALGIVEQPTEYASRHGPFGFLKGMGKAVVGAVIKPIVGVGDAAVLVMNHVSDATSNHQVKPKIPKRLRRALPCRSSEQLNDVEIKPYDEKAAKAQKIVTGGESVEDEYVGHVNIPSHLIIASQQCLWAIDRRSREPWYINWEDISHFSIVESSVRVVVFSQIGLRNFVFQVNDPTLRESFRKLLSMQHSKMGNSYELSTINQEPESFTKRKILGIKSQQVAHVFGSYNGARPRGGEKVNNEVDLIEMCNKRVSELGSESTTFLKTLDLEAWWLVSHWGQLFSGLSSRRCLVAGIINGTGGPVQIKSTKLVEGGSACYALATKEYDRVQGILYPGGCIIFFGWGVVPNLSKSGSICMEIETNSFLCSLSDQKDRRYTFAEATPGFQVGFLEKSYDESGWWAKYWLLIRST